MKTGVTEAVGRHLLSHRHVARTTKGPGGTETHIVDQHNDHVGRTLWWTQRLDRWEGGVTRIQRGHRWTYLLLNGQDLAPDGLVLTIRFLVGITCHVRFLLPREIGCMHSQKRSTSATEESSPPARPGQLSEAARPPVCLSA